MPASYSFTPQFATIRSASPLAGMRPVVAAPEIRHTALAFERFEPFKIRSEQPELVTGGIASAISEGAGSALKGITAAYVGEREKKEAREKEDREHARAVELAGIRSKGTPEEEEYQRKYRELSLQNIKSQIEQRGGDKKPVVPVRPAGQFQRSPVVEPELPTETEPKIDFETPILGDINVSSLQGITPPVAAMPDATPAEALKKRMAEQKEEDLQKLRMQIAQESSQAPLASIPVPTNILAPEGVIASQTDFSQLPLVPIDEGSAEQLALQPPPPSSPIPQNPQQMADFAEQQLLARERKLQAITPGLDAMQRKEANARQQAQGMEPVLLPEEVAEPTSADQFLGNYRSFEDALYANEQLGKLLPGYQTQEVVAGVDENGMPFYEVKPPVRKATGTSATGVPEGMVVKQITDKDGQLTTTYVPKIPVKQQIVAFDNNIRKAKVLKETLDKIEELTPGWFGLGGQGAGGLSWLMSKLPWSNDAQTVRGLLDTVKGIIGFDELVALKAAGGSLGALSDAELSMLTSLQGSVDANLSEEVFLQNIKKIKEHAIKLQEGLEADKSELMKVEKTGGFQPIQNIPTLKTQAEVDAFPGGDFIYEGVQYSKPKKNP